MWALWLLDLQCTLGYVRCQDLRQSFDSPDQLVMVIRAPPETQMQVSEPSEVSPPPLFFLLFSTPACFSKFCPAPFPQGYQVSLKSTRGQIDVFLCPEDSSGVCSPVTGTSPSKTGADPSLASPLLPHPAEPPPQLRSSAAAQEAALASPVSTSSTATAASQQESTAIGGDAGEASLPSSCFSQKRRSASTAAGSQKRGFFQFWLE